MTTQTLTLRIEGTAQGLRAAVVDGKGGLQDLERQAGATGSAFSRLGGLMAGALSVRAVVDAANEWGTYTARVAQATRTNEALAQVSDRVYESAQRTRSDLVATATLYERVDKVVRDLGGSTAQSTVLVETINKSFLISGTSAQAASGAILQFTQGLQSGVLRGDEFNSVMENAPTLADALSKSLGVTRGELRAMAEAGELSAARILQAIGEAAPEISRQFEQVAVRPGEAFQQLSNAFTRAVGEMDQAVGGSSTIAAGLQALTGYVEQFPRALQGWGTAFAQIQEVGDGFFTDFFGNLDLIGYSVSDVVGKIGQEFLILPQSLRTTMVIIVGEFDKLLARGTFLFASIGVSAQEVWLSIRENAVGMGNRVEEVFAQMSDAIGRKLASIAKDAADVFSKVGLSSVADELRVVEQQLLASATAESEVQARIRDNVQGYQNEKEALSAKRVELLQTMDASVAATQAGIDGALADRDAALAAVAAGKAKKDEAAATGLATNAINKGTDASAKLSKQQKESAKASQALTVEQERLTAKLGGPGVAAAIELAQALRGVDQREAALRATHKLTREEVDQLNRIRGQLIESYQRETQAVQTLTNPYADYVAKLAEERRQLGLNTAERARYAAAIAATNSVLEYANQVHDQGRPLSIDEIANLIALRKGQDAYATATDRAAESAQNWQQYWGDAVGSVSGALGDFFASGMQDFSSFGDSLKNIAQRIMSDLVATFARRLILNLGVSASGAGGAGGGGGLNLSNLFGSGGGTAGTAGGLFGNNTGGFGSFGGNLAGGFAGAFTASQGIRSGNVGQGLLGGATAGFAVGGPWGALVGAIIGGLSAAINGKPKPDFRLGGEQGSVRSPEGSFATVFGNVRAGSRILSYQSLIQPIQQFDQAIQQMVLATGGGAAQLTAIGTALSRWSVDLRGNAATAEGVLGSRFGAILATFSADVQAFVGTTGTVEERVGRLNDALTISALADGELEASFTDLAATLLEARDGNEDLADTYARMVTGMHLVDDTLGILGGSFDGTRLQAAAFANDLIAAAGGMEAFSQKLQAALNALFSPEEQAQFIASQAETAFRTALQGVGLNFNDGIESIRTSLRRMIRDALAAGNVDEANRLLGVGAAMGVYIDATARLNTTNEEAATVTTTVAQATETAADRMARLARQVEALGQYRDFFDEIRLDNLSDGVSDFNRQMIEVAQWQAQAITRANELARAAGMQGASEEDLAEIRIRATQRTRAAYLALEAATGQLIEQLYAMADAQREQIETGNGALNIVQSWARTQNEVATSRFDPQRFQGASQIAQNIRQMAEFSGRNAFEIADRLQLPLDRFVRDLGVVLARLSEPEVFDDFVSAAQSLGVELPDFAQRMGVSIGNLADASSLINDAFERAIARLPKAQQDRLTTLRRDLEGAQTPEARATALAAIETFVNTLPVSMRAALAPFLEGVDTTSIQEETTNAVRAVEGAINTSNAFLGRILEALGGGRLPGEKSAGDRSNGPALGGLTDALGMLAAQVNTGDVQQLSTLREVDAKLGDLLRETRENTKTVRRMLEQLMRSGS